MPDTPNEKPTTEEIHLHTAGSVAGIPGSHGPGRYLVNWLTREITPIVEVVEAEVAHIKETLHPPQEAPALIEQQATAPTAAADTVKEE